MHSPVLRQPSILGFKRLLDLDCTLHRIHYASKFSKYIVARGVHHPPPMVKDPHRDSFAMLLQGFDRGLFILAHQAAVPLDISTENSGELAFKALFSHGITTFFSRFYNSERTQD